MTIYRHWTVGCSKRAVVRRIRVSSRWIGEFSDQRLVSSIRAESSKYQGSVVPPHAHSGGGVTIFQEIEPGIAISMCYRSPRKTGIDERTKLRSAHRRQSADLRSFSKNRSIPMKMFRRFYGPAMCPSLWQYDGPHIDARFGHFSWPNRVGRRRDDCSRFYRTSVIRKSRLTMSNGFFETDPKFTRQRSSSNGRRAMFFFIGYHLLSVDSVIKN